MMALKESIFKLSIPIVIGTQIFKFFPGSIRETK